jgi:hypothetical protein
MVMAEGAAKFKRELPKPRRPAENRLDAAGPKQGWDPRERRGKIGGYFVR